jgi:hypothetical protein
MSGSPFGTRATPPSQHGMRSKVDHAEYHKRQPFATQLHRKKRKLFVHLHFLCKLFSCHFRNTQIVGSAFMLKIDKGHEEADNESNLLPSVVETVHTGRADYRKVSPLSQLTLHTRDKYGGQCESTCKLPYIIYETGLVRGFSFLLVKSLTLVAAMTHGAHACPLASRGRCEFLYL